MYKINNLGIKIYENIEKFDNINPQFINTILVNFKYFDLLITGRIINERFFGLKLEKKYTDEK